MRDFTEAVNELAEEITQSPEKKVRMQFGDFLRRLGLTKRVKGSLTRIEALLTECKIFYEFPGRPGDVEYLHEYPKEEYLTFRLKTSACEPAEIQATGKKARVDCAGTIQVSPGTPDRKLFLHQEEAIRSLNNKTKANPNSFAGLLAIPTGGGKTMTAAWWSLSKLIGNTKVIWIAHRHELLNQAAEAFRLNACSEVMGRKTPFKYRIVSGVHDKPVHIRPSDDLIIASKDSLQQDLTNVIKTLKSGENSSDSIFLIVDEAHHATAKSYRSIIDTLRSNFTKFHMLGLTATPWRTAENERGLLKRVFSDDIVYKVDLKTLIARGILAQPKFHELKTKVDMTEIVSEEELANIQHFDIDTIGKDTAKKLAENRTRNAVIVDDYMDNKEKYGQTLVFAINVLNAIALDALFKEHGVSSDFVVGEIRQQFTGMKFSPKENLKKITQFREKKISVLINVNIVTEGIDVPGVETVFLTRPTISSVLMTQMIGRGLRGEKAGGKSTVNIVSFVDEWRDKIAWVNPEKLYIEENADFNDKSSETQRQIVRLISIEKIGEFARIMDRTVDAAVLALDFIQRVPVGIYSFLYLDEFSGKKEAPEKRCEVLVYDNMVAAYKKFVSDLSGIFSEDDVLPRNPRQADFVELGRRVEEEYFPEVEKYGYSPDDVSDILKYYCQHSTEPTFVEFKDRAKFDIGTVAETVAEMSTSQKLAHLQLLWSEDQNEWRTFFGYDFLYFLHEVDWEIYRKKGLVPEKDGHRHVVDYEERDYERLTMDQLREVDVDYWRKLRDSVFALNQDRDGFYVCQKSGFRSKQKVHFHIDHVIPFSHGGLTTVDNLQLLHFRENLRKGSRPE